MRFTRLAAAVLLLPCPVATCLANGGPFAEGIVATGNGTLLTNAAPTNVSIETEDLEVDLHQEFAEVRLRYRMRNAGAAVNQDFFYPVESWSGDVDRYALEADGKPLPATTVDAKGAPARTGKIDPDEGDWDKAPKPIRRWRKSVIPFGGNQSRDIFIRYRSRYGEYGADVSDDTRREARFFSFRLSPAAAWKESIQRGRIVIQARLPEPENVAIEQPAGKFKATGPGRWEWNFQNLRPTLSDDLRVITQPSYISYGRPFPLDAERTESVDQADYRIVGKRAYLEHTLYEAVASSTLAPGKSGQTYGTDNLRGTGESTWAEGAEGDGLGESLTLTVKHPLPLDAILIRPGFFQREKADLWTKNNRVAKCEITLNDEHRFTADLPDERFENPYPIPVRGYDKPVKSVLLVIKAVHRGSAYRDTCISYLGLRAKLAKVPEIQGAR